MHEYKESKIVINNFLCSYFVLVVNDFVRWLFERCLEVTDYGCLVELEEFYLVVGIGGRFET